MVKKTTFSKQTLILFQSGIRAIFLTFIFIMSAFTARSAEFTSFSWSTSDSTARDTTVITFEYQIVTASPDIILSAYLPSGNNSNWMVIDSVDVLINGTPAAVNTTLSSVSGRSLKVILTNPALAVSGANIKLTAYAINGQYVGNFNWDYIRSANADNSVVDKVTSPAGFKAVAPVPENLPPSNAFNITDTSFTTSWSATEYANGYILEVATNTIFTNYVPGYNNIDLGNVTSKVVSGLTANSTYYYRIRAYNAAGTSDYSSYKTVTTSKLNQTITFDVLPSKVYGDVDYDISASASSGLTVSFSSSNTNVATVTGTLVQIVGAGSTTITASQAGNAQYKAATNVQRSLVVNPLSLLVTGVSVNDKVYDALNTAVVSDFGNLAGVINSDVVAIDGSNANATFSDKAVGINKTVTITGLKLTGADSANYSIGDVSAKAKITARPLTLQRMDVLDKVYDGTTDATISNFGVLINTAAGDVVTTDHSAADAIFASKNAGDSIAVTITGITLSGVDKDNYKIDSIYPAYGNITKAEITITAADDVKSKDGVAYSGGNGVIYEGFIAGESPTVLTGTLTYGGTSQGAINAGVYTIIPQGLSAINYNIVYVNGSLTINGVGIKEDPSLAPMTYPNPFSEMININNAEMVSQIRISNLVGQEVINYTNNGSSDISIPVAELNQGIYIIVVEMNSGEHFTQKIVKK